ncbi:helix-turn-helix domain-containing protein [Lactobacillus jensenii]|uniref:helix-turn-helix domain-containing protein n=1 Tax=Lactobacillus jensenii TaxID=109790 RepID=UPI0029C4090B|nr:helix-turn-helix transcriptional regulator [Lactobacillus jensenii]MDX5103562.1 helix-turn-helix transcriptional regulator [Lactobacillus jensenii]MDX5115456.1 helix-turn-helix transcriptional regulator [Lactobacillus jensenii]
MIGDRLAQVRVSKKLSQAETAKLIGVAQATWAQYEKGKRMPSVETLNHIAKVFNVSTDYLINGETPNQNAIDLKKTDVLSYDGKPVSDEDLAIIRAILERNK